jgi:beta-lactamase regulating signal transducer with metallopeptidase domain
MNALFGNLLGGMSSPGIVELIIDTALKGTFVCTVAGLTTLLLRRSSAFARNVIWVFTLVILLLLPLAHIAAPFWNLPLIPRIESWRSESAAAGDMDIAGNKQLDPGSSGALDGASRGGGSAGRLFGLPVHWRTWTFLVWATGAFLCLAWFSINAILTGRLLRMARTADEGWLELSREVSGKLGLASRVLLFQSEHVRTAVTIGALNPAIVLPAESNHWPREKRRFILSHELAHIQRRDTLIEIIVLLVMSMYWFNPLVWMSIKRLRVERERDCDDVVLNTGAKPSDYAMLLLDIAADLKAPPRPAWRLSTISQGSNLKDRIMCILDAKIDRNRGRRRTVIISCILLAVLILPLSLSGLWETKAQEKSKTEQQELEKKKQLELKKKMAPEEKIGMMWKKMEQQENSAAVIVHNAIVKYGIDAGIKKYKKMKASGGDAYLFKEAEFNTVGYKFLYAKKIKEAIAVFKLNVDAFPDSWNTYDSLAEGFLVAGKYDKAKELYKKSIAMNPENENGIKMLEKIAQLEGKKDEKVAKE